MNNYLVLLAVLSGAIIGCFGIALASDAKSQFAGLSKKILYAVARRQLEEALAKSERNIASWLKMPTVSSLNGIQ
ncbi:MAG: hypothetical protein WCJ93_12470 [Methanomicrobiales archaeon]